MSICNLYLNLMFELITQTAVGNSLTITAAEVKLKSARPQLPYILKCNRSFAQSSPLVLPEAALSCQR